MSEQTQAQTSVGSLSPSVETGSITEQDGGACVAGEVLPSLPSGPTNVATSGLEVTVAETSEEKRNRYVLMAMIYRYMKLCVCGVVVC